MKNSNKPDDTSLKRSRISGNVDFFQFIDNFQDWVWEMDVAGYHTFSNNAVTKLLGYQVKEVVGIHVSKLWDEINDYSLEYFNKTMASGKGWTNFRGIFRHKNGQLVYTESTARPIKDDSGNVIGYQGIDRDITERVALENSLKESQQEIAAIFDDPKTLIAILDLEGKIIKVNNTALSIIDSSLSKLYDKYFWDTDWWVHSAELQTKVREGIIQAANGEVVSFEANHFDKNSNEIFVSFHLRPIRNFDGEIYRIIAEGNDINDLKSTEKLLKESTDKFHTLYDSTPVAIMLYQDDKWIFMNKAALEITEYDAQDLDNDNFWDLVHPDDRAMVKQNGQARQANKDSIDNYQFRIITKSNSIKWIHLFGTSTLINGKSAGLITVLDITQNKIAEEQLEKSKELLKKTSSILRHDIGNDLSVINSAVKIYQRTGNATMLDEVKKRLKKSLHRIDQHRKSELFIDKFVGMDIIELSPIFRSVAKKYPKIELELSGKGKVYADQAFIKIISHLFSNAILHGGATKVKVEIKKIDNKYQINFFNNGSRISPDIENDIFSEGFYSGNKNTVGIGLYFVKKTIEGYAGSIYLDQSVASGVKFIIILNAELTEH